jgi:anti-sigma regulatory factor (Ser/Thr protein kinase)
MNLSISSEKELARLPVTQTHDILLARMVAREEAAKLGFSTKALTQISTSVSEITRNVIQHAHAPGQFRIFQVISENRRGLMISVEDEGCRDCQRRGGGRTWRSRRRNSGMPKAHG